MAPKSSSNRRRAGRERVPSSESSDSDSARVKTYNSVSKASSGRRGRKQGSANLGDDETAVGGAAGGAASYEDQRGGQYGPSTSEYAIAKGSMSRTAGAGGAASDDETDEDEETAPLNQSAQGAGGQPVRQASSHKMCYSLIAVVVILVIIAAGVVIYMYENGDLSSLTSDLTGNSTVSASPASLAAASPTSTGDEDADTATATSPATTADDSGASTGGGASSATGLGGGSSMAASSAATSGVSSGMSGLMPSAASSATSGSASAGSMMSFSMDQSSASGKGLGASGSASASGSGTHKTDGTDVLITATSNSTIITQQTGAVIVSDGVTLTGAVTGSGAGAGPTATGTGDPATATGSTSDAVHPATAAATASGTGTKTARVTGTTTGTAVSSALTADTTAVRSGWGSEYYTSGSATACGITWTNTDSVVGISSGLYGDPTAVSGYCGLKVKIENPDVTGTPQVEATVVDICDDCGDTDLILSTGAYNVIVGPDNTSGTIGTIYWQFEKS